MAVTKGHGNPNWTRDEVVLALDLYFQCGGRIPDKSDPRVRDLSAVLRAFPHHSFAARKPSFRNPDGVAFKLQNIRQVATGKGLSNVSRVDREVWNEFGSTPDRVKELANLIRSGVQVVDDLSSDEEEVEFVEGRVVTETHLRRERNPGLRKQLIAQRRKDGRLWCEMCREDGSTVDGAFVESLFECHHVIPLSTTGARKTTLKDLALLCATCHRMLHRAIATQREWLSIDAAKALIFR